MDILQLKGETVIWKTSNTNWLLNFDELVNVYLYNRHPYKKGKLSTPTIAKIKNLIKTFAGEWFAEELDQIKNYKKIKNIRIPKLQQKLGSGKYSTVYELGSYAIKAITHKKYPGLPPTTGKHESQIMNFLKTKLLYGLYSPNIVLLHQYIPTAKVDYLMMEKLDSTLWSFVHKYPNAKKLRGIIIQVLFTLVILQKLVPDFRHNDLKIDNILLDFKPRKKDITLRYKNYYWKLAKDIPLVKIADYDYACVKDIYNNPKVDTKFSAGFGCTHTFSKIYDLHIFLNSIHHSKSYLPNNLSEWLETILPKPVRGHDNKHLKYGRLKNPASWNGKINTPFKILISSFFKNERLAKPQFPIWGIA